METHGVEPFTILLLRRGTSRGEGGHILPYLDPFHDTAFHDTAFLFQLWQIVCGLRIRGNVVRELEGRELRSMIGRPERYRTMRDLRILAAVDFGSN